MKTKSSPKGVSKKDVYPSKGTITVTHKKDGGYVVRGRDKTIAVRDSQGRDVKGGTETKSQALSYDEQSIEESNRIGSALCRQNAS